MKNTNKTGLQEKINKDIRSAILEKESIKLAALRSVKSELIIEMSKDGAESVPDNVVESIISRLVKQRKESALIFTEQGREDLAEEEKNQLSFLEIYLPEQMREKDIRSVAEEIISQIGASSPSEMGKVMALIMERLKGKADGKIISNIVREMLNR